MSKGTKPLININVPKVGRVKVFKTGLVSTAFSLGILAAGWYWSERAPYIGPYAFTVKAWLRQLVGQQVRS